LGVVSNYKSYLKGNTYTNISMGSNAFVQSFSSKEGQVAGSLMKFINIHAVDLIDENYINIGAFTNEHMTEVIKKVRDVPNTFMNLPISI
jgi:hypothetical protein